MEFDRDCWIFFKFGFHDLSSSFIEYKVAMRMREPTYNPGVMNQKLY